MEPPQYGDKSDVRREIQILKSLGLLKLEIFKQIDNIYLF